MQRCKQSWPFIRRSPVPWLVAGALALVVATDVVAETPPEVPALSVAGSRSVAESPSPAGLRAYLDPATGELTDAPSREQVEELSRGLEQSLNRSSEGLETFALRSGGRGVFLRGRFLSALTVRMNADGSFEMSCTDDPEQPQADAAAHEHHDSEAAAPTQWVEQ